MMSIKQAFLFLPRSKKKKKKKNKWIYFMNTTRKNIQVIARSNLILTDT